MNQSINYACNRKYSSNDSTDLDKKIQEIILVLLVFNCDRRQIKPEEYSRKCHGRRCLIRVTSELMHMINISFDVFVSCGYNLKGLVINCLPSCNIHTQFYDGSEACLCRRWD